MALTLSLFVGFGLLFGLASFSRRHLFSEGTTAPADAQGPQWAARLGWCALCSLLWPLLLATGGASALMRRSAGRRGR